MPYQIMFTDELYHHGIKGQRWGIRRYRNADGSLTKAGIARYGIKEAKREYRQAKRDYKNAKRFMKSKDFKKEKKTDISKARLNYIDKEAALAGLKSNKKEFNTYKTWMLNTERRGITKGRSLLRKTRQEYAGDLYYHLCETKGKQYADNVLKSIKKDRIAVAVGAAGVVPLGYLIMKRYGFNHPGINVV